MADRMQSGLKLYQQEKVHVDCLEPGKMRFFVNGSKKGEFYDVEQLGEHWTCNCGDFYYRHVKEYDDLEDYGFGVMLCKHMYSVFFKLMELKVGDQTKLDVKE